VPYIAHQDFTRGVRELTELVDYVTLNLSIDTETSGIAQFYNSQKALSKLLKNAHQARVNELGKAAAFEFEKYQTNVKRMPLDYSTSIQRSYQRNSMLSTLRPLLVFVEVDLDHAKIKNKAEFLERLVANCKEH